MTLQIDPVHYPVHYPDQFRVDDPGGEVELQQCCGLLGVHSLQYPPSPDHGRALPRRPAALHRGTFARSGKGT